MSRRTLGTLTIDLILKMGGFEEGMSRASRETKQRMKEIGKNVDVAAERVKHFIGLSVAAVSAGAAITAALVNSARQSIDQQSKLARSLDTTYDSLTALQLRAGDAGIDGLDASLNRLNRRLGAVAMETGPAVKTVEALKLNLSEMADMDIDRRIGYIGDRIREMGLSNEEAARHLQQLGFEQQAAIELFRDGSDQIDRYRREVVGLGLAVNDLDAYRVEQMNDALGIFGDMQQSIANQLTVGLAPSILAIAESLEQAWISNASAAGESTAAIEQMMDRLIVGGVNTAATFRSGGIAIKNMADDIWSGFQSLPSWAQEVGIVGAILGGKKGLAALMLLGKAVDDTKVTATWFKAMTAGDVGFFEWLTHGADGARERLAELGIEIQNIQHEGPSIMESLFGAPSAEDSKAWADSIIQGYRERVEAARNISAIVPIQSSIDPEFSPIETNDEGAKKAQRLLDLYNSQNESLLRQLALFQEGSLAAQYLYDIQHGALSELTPVQQQQLMDLAKELDLKREMAEEDAQRLQDQVARMESLKQYGEHAARNIQDALANYLFDPFQDGLDGMLKGLGNTLRQMASQVAAQTLLKSLIGGMSNSSVGWMAKLGGAFAGAFDGGGRIPAGQWGIVGEIGPEIVTGPAVVTSRADTARQLSGSNVNINVINNAGVSVRQERSWFDGNRMNIDLVIEAFRTGLNEGHLDADFASVFGVSRAGGRA